MTEKILGVIGAKPRRLNWIAEHLGISEEETLKLLNSHKKALDFLEHGSKIRIRSKYQGMRLQSYYLKSKKGVKS